MYRLQQHQVHLELCVSLFLRPEIERDRGNFIHHRISQSIASQVHRLDVVPAGVAAFHAYMFELLRRIDRKFRVVLFSASRTNDSPELPLAQTERTHQRALSTVSQWPQNAHSRFARAEGTQTRRGPCLPLPCSLPDEFRVGLEKRPREEFLVSVSFVFTSNERKSISCPKGTQQLALAVCSLIPQFASCCRNRAGTDSLDQGQESRKTIDRHEEAQHLGGKRVLVSQLFGPRNPPLVQGLRHGRDYRPQRPGAQCPQRRLRQFDAIRSAAKTPSD